VTKHALKLPNRQSTPNCATTSYAPGSVTAPLLMNRCVAISGVGETVIR
jgi:hypothetical protein